MKKTLMDDTQLRSIPSHIKSCEQENLTFIDLFAGLGGFHVGLARHGFKCVFASEINLELQDLYEKNLGIRPVGDIRGISNKEIPKHDILCAGFPCQPYSKAGSQEGQQCPKWGDLFSHVLRIIAHHQPSYFILENVPNLLNHNGGKTWKEMYRQLLSAGNAGYEVRAKLLSPIQFGIPQNRERALIVGSKLGMKSFEWPREMPKLQSQCSIESILDVNPPDAVLISERLKRCLNVWQEFLDHIPESDDFRGPPIWSMEFGATYPYKEGTHRLEGIRSLRKYRGSHGVPLKLLNPEDRLLNLPSHARGEELFFPRWKISFIEWNRNFYSENKSWLKNWIPKIKEFPSSWQKLEWNCKGDKRIIANNMIQVRASGIRVKRRTSAPSLIAMTSTQVPIIGWEGRYMTPAECSRLQNLGTLSFLPQSNAVKFKALGNAVNSEIVYLVAKHLICPNRSNVAKAG
jgi:DNA (cytosine-5)-methyltransferase 1